MKRLIFIFASVLILASTSFAEAKNITAKWAAYAAPAEVTVTGFKIYEKGGAAVATITGAAITTAAFSQDFAANQCRTYYLIANTSAGDSPASNEAMACSLAAPTSLNITITN